MNKEFYKTATSIGAALVIIGFFLPWVSMGPFSMSGYDIPKIAEMFSGMARNEASSGAQLYYILYLIPLLSGYLLYSEYKGSNKFFILVKIIVFLLVAFVIYKLSTLGNNKGIFEISGFGLWVTVAGSIYLLIQAIKEFKKPATVNTNEEVQKQPSGTPIKEMFDQATKQAKVRIRKISFKWIAKYKIVIIFSLVIIITGIALFFIFHKNSYQKAFSFIEEGDYKQAKYYSDKCYSEINEEKLELSFDEKNNLDLIPEIASLLEKVNAAKQEFSIQIKPEYSQNADIYNKTITNLASNVNVVNNLTLKDLLKKSSVGLDINKILQKSVCFSDSVNISFLEYLLNDSLLLAIKNNKMEFSEENYSSIEKNVNIVIDNIIEKELNKEKIKSLQSKLNVISVAIKESITSRETAVNNQQEFKDGDIRTIVGTIKGYECIEICVLTILNEENKEEVIMQLANNFEGKNLLIDENETLLQKCLNTKYKLTLRYTETKNIDVGDLKGWEIKKVETL